MSLTGVCFPLWSRFSRDDDEPDGPLLPHAGSSDGLKDLRSALMSSSLLLSAH